jgi:DNA-binding transcriptional MerR regulator
MRVGELAKRSGISASTLRYYEKLALLRRASRNASGYREYTKEALDQLALIQRAKELGFSLREIRALLARPRGASREAVLAAVASKLTELERARKDLGSTERHLRRFRSQVLRDGDKRVDDLTGWLMRRDKEEKGLTLTRSSLGHFDKDGHRVISMAADEAKRYHHGWLGTEHLLLAFAQLDCPAVRTIFTSERLEIDDVRRAFEKVLAGSETSDDSVSTTPRVQRVMGIAEGIALRDERRATPEDLLLAILEDGEGLAVGLIRECGGDPARIAAPLRDKLA